MILGPGGCLSYIESLEILAPSIVSRVEVVTVKKTVAQTVAFELSQMAVCERAGKTEEAATHRSEALRLVRFTSPRNAGCYVNGLPRFAVEDSNLDLARSDAKKLTIMVRVARRDLVESVAYTNPEIVCSLSPKTGMSVRVKGGARGVKQDLLEAYTEWLSEILVED